MTINDAMMVGFKDFKDLLVSASPDLTVCVTGRHAVGKSEGVFQAAAEKRSDFYRSEENCSEMIKVLGEESGGKVRYLNKWVDEWNYEMGIPVLERRLSQMTEGDMIGMPQMNNIVFLDESLPSTSFRPCDWLVQACMFPVVLFLDERNRALPGVKQSVFQLCDSKAFYGYKLHDETGIVIAENVGEAYQVEQNDPAEISRSAMIVLEPSVDEWLSYARDIVHESIIDFIIKENAFLEHKGTYEPNKKYPDRRVWVKFSAEAERLGLLDMENPPTLLRVLAGSMLGIEAGQAFYSFCLERDRAISATEILADWPKAQAKLLQDHGKSNERYIEAVNKLGGWLDKNSLDETKAVEMANFLFDCPPEPRMALWAYLQGDTSNLLMVHPYTKMLIVATATSDTVNTCKPNFNEQRKIAIKNKTKRLNQEKETA